MSWIGLRDHNGTQRFHPGGLVGDRNNVKRVSADAPMAKGTLLIETIHDPDKVRRNLLRFAANTPWHSALRLTLDPDGTLRLLMAQGQVTADFALKTDLHTHKGTAAIWFTWDAPARKGQLAVLTSTNEFYCCDLFAPIPLCFRDADRICTHPQTTQIDAATTFVAIADSIEPVGPPATLSGQSIIETPNGHVRLETLKPGATVVTADGEAAQIRSIAAQTLPARGMFTPHIIRAPYYGARTDLSIGPRQHIELGGSKIEYLFLTEYVLTEVGHLTDGREVLATSQSDFVTYYHVMLDRHDVLELTGVRLTSLDPAPFRQNAAMRQHGILRNVPQELIPAGPSIDLQHLRNFEAVLIPNR
jgi:hypothetical protein